MMASAPAAKKKRKKETVSRKTFLKWGCKDDFNIEVDNDDNIVKIICKVCTTYLQQITGLKQGAEILEERYWRAC